MEGIGGRGSFFHSLVIRGCRTNVGVLGQQQTFHLGEVKHYQMDRSFWFRFFVCALKTSEGKVKCCDLKATRSNLQICTFISNKPHVSWCICRQSVTSSSHLCGGILSNGGEASSSLVYLCFPSCVTVCCCVHVYSVQLFVHCQRLVFARTVACVCGGCYQSRGGNYRSSLLITPSIARGLN